MHFPNAVMLIFKFFFAFLPLIQSVHNCVQNRNHLVCKKADLTSISDVLDGKGPIMHLTLHMNNISHIPAHAFSRWPLLQHLSLQHNEITSIDKDAFSGLTKLIQLDLSVNAFTSLPDTLFAPLASLVDLRISNGKLSHLPLISNCPKLRKLHLDSNAITSLQFSPEYSKCKQLMTLVLSNNPIVRLNATDLAVFKAAHITTFQLKDSKTLQDIDPAFFEPVRHSLQNVHLDRNSLLTSEAVHRMLQGLQGTTKLKQLFLSHLDLQELGEDYFRSLDSTQMTILNLRGNSLKHIHNTAFSNLRLLAQLDLSQCELDDAMIRFTDLERLKNLQLSGNHFLEVPHYLPRALESLDLSNNQIVRISQGVFSDMDKLKWLNLDRNSLHSLQLENMFEGLRRLNHLSLRDNDLNTIPANFFVHLSQVSLLDLSKQKQRMTDLQENAFLGLMHVQTLNLSYNALGPFFRSAKAGPVLATIQNSLRSLDLTGNAITGLHEDVFSSNVMLQHLNLSHNQISLFPSRLVERLAPNLQRLYLDFNQLAFLRTTSSECPGEHQWNNLAPLMSRKGFHFSARENPANCSCVHLVQWWAALTNPQWHYPWTQRIRCETPLELQTRLLLNLHTQTSKCAQEIVPKDGTSCTAQPQDVPHNNEEEEVHKSNVSQSLVPAHHRANKTVKTHHTIVWSLVTGILGIVGLCVSYTLCRNRRIRNRLRYWFHTVRRPACPVVFHVPVQDNGAFPMKDFIPTSVPSPSHKTTTATTKFTPQSPRHVPNRLPTDEELLPLYAVPSTGDGILELLDDIIPDVTTKSEEPQQLPCEGGHNPLDETPICSMRHRDIQNVPDILNPRHVSTAPADSPRDDGQPTKMQSPTNPFLEGNEIVWHLSIFLGVGTSLSSDHSADEELCHKIMEDLHKRESKLLINFSSAGFSLETAQRSSMNVLVRVPTEEVPLHHPQWNAELAKKCFTLSIIGEHLTLCNVGANPLDANGAVVLRDLPQLSRYIRRVIFQ